MARAGTSWRMVQCRPGSHPFRALARALASDGVLFRVSARKAFHLVDIVEATLRMSKLGLADISEQAGSRRREPAGGRGPVRGVVPLRKATRAPPAQRADRSQEAVAFVNLLLEARAQATCRSTSC